MPRSTPTRPRTTRTRSPLTRSQRIERANELFSRGYSNTDVARELQVARGTARAYREIYEQRLSEKVSDNPHVLTDVLANTIRQIEELDQARRALWSEFEQARRPIDVMCEHCDHTTTIVISSATTRNALMGNILKSQEQRAKLYGVLGVKAEFFAMVASVKAVQDALLRFMATELCPSDRTKLDEYLSGPEMAPYMSTSPLAIEAESWEQAG